MQHNPTIGANLVRTFRLYRFVRHDHLMLTLTGVSLGCAILVAFLYLKYESLVLPVLHDGWLFYLVIAAWFLRASIGAIRKGHSLTKLDERVCALTFDYRLQHKQDMSLEQCWALCKTLYDDYLRTESMYAGQLIMIGLIGTSGAIFYGLTNVAIAGSAESDLVKNTLYHALAIGSFGVGLSCSLYIWASVLIDLVQCRIDYLAQGATLNARAN